MDFERLRFSEVLARVDPEEAEAQTSLDSAAVGL